MSLIFLKLGGSLITDKTHPYTPRLEKLDFLAEEIASVLKEKKDLQLVLGHGSGSFGHAAASGYKTRLGVSGPAAWFGFAEVWYQASSLNRIVVEALHRAGLPAITLSPAASITAHDGNVAHWDHYPIQAALLNGLLPVIHGDVAFDEIRGGTILSTEDLFAHLARKLSPQRILLAGLEAGVWADFPAKKQLLAEMTPGSFARHASGLGTAAGTDVTGGMLSKVTGMLSLIEQIPDLEVLIFSGEQAGNLTDALRGQNPGTRLHC
ncbi:MAG: isopentenyl phosphate kinase [Anaerolineales bacterium]|jgi:isopentenyl phosphate kinase